MTKRAFHNLSCKCRVIDQPDWIKVVSYHHNISKKSYLHNYEVDINHIIYNNIRKLKSPTYVAR